MDRAPKLGTIDWIKAVSLTPRNPAANKKLMFVSLSRKGDRGSMRVSVS